MRTDIHTDTHTHETTTVTLAAHARRGLTTSVDGWKLGHASVIQDVHMQCLHCMCTSCSCMCLQKYLKELGPPNDICIQHEEWHTYMVGETSQSHFGNAYYHARIASVHLVWPRFQPSMLVVLLAIECKLQDVHKCWFTI